jgi:hypothetical protein
MLRSIKISDGRLRSQIFGLLRPACPKRRTLVTNRPCPFTQRITGRRHQAHLHRANLEHKAGDIFSIEQRELTNCTL